MKKELKEKFIWKHETRKDLFKDIISCVIIAYVAFLAFLLVDSRIKYVNAQTDYVSSQIHAAQQTAHMME